MGLEAYRLIVKLQDTSISQVDQELKKIGFTQIGMYQKDIELEFEKPSGVIEMLLTTVEESNKGSLILTNSSEYKSCQTQIGNIIMHVRFAKVSHSNIVDDIIDVIKAISYTTTIEFVGDVEAKTQVDTSSYEDLRKRVEYSKIEFEKWFPEIPYPIRCKDVFPTYRKLNPDKVVKEYESL
jgi:hypothetical protein